MMNPKQRKKERQGNKKKNTHTQYFGRWNHNRRKNAEETTTKKKKEKERERDRE